MKQIDKDKMNAGIIRHGQQLNAIFNTGLDPVYLCRRLRRLEAEAHRLTTDECNTGANHYSKLSHILTRVKKLLFPGDQIYNTDQGLYLAVYINGDPRGYALKIQDKYVREHNLNIYRDWGGYGILAPDFTPNEG